VIVTLSSAAPAFVPVPVTSLTNAIVDDVPEAVNVSECRGQPIAAPLRPVVSKVKLLVTPFTVTASGLTAGGPPGLPARSNATTYVVPGTVSKVWATPPTAKLPTRSSEDVPCDETQLVVIQSTVPTLTVQPGICVLPAGMSKTNVAGAPASKLPFWNGAACAAVARKSAAIAASHRGMEMLLSRERPGRRR
jgi:hypothetical protein